MAATLDRVKHLAGAAVRGGQQAGAPAGGAVVLQLHLAAHLRITVNLTSTPAPHHLAPVDVVQHHLVRDELGLALGQTSPARLVQTQSWVSRLLIVYSS